MLQPKSTSQYTETQAATIESQEDSSCEMRFLDPRAALITFLVGLLGLLETGNPFWLFCETAILLLIALSLGAGRKLVTMSRSLLFFLVLVGLAGWLEGGLTALASTLARVVALVVWATLLFVVAPPEKLVEGLRQWGLPLRIAFVVNTGLRFVPQIADLFHELRDAQEARGISFTPFWKHGKAYLALFLPLLREIFRMVDQVAQALESRGFSAHPRTPLDKRRWKLSDVLILVVSSMCCIAILLFGR
ncbi:MAG: energy-coupling factor transporter transmembrane component T [Ktedonobacteraceae bacterium]